MGEQFDVLVTAEEAWPVFERAVLDTKQEIVAGFRIFDFRTRLRSEEARVVGDTWFDLIEDALQRGVRFHLIVSDFDPVMATELHTIAWDTQRQAAALAEIAGTPRDQLRVEVALHPAKAGMVPWASFLPAVLKRQRAALEKTPWRKRQRLAVGLDEAEWPQMHTVTHHQKLAVFDGKKLYVGGLDLNERRWDTRDHNLRAERTWSDVQVMMTGPEAQEARTHLLSFQENCAGTKPPPEMRAIKRTLCTPRRVQFPFLSPRTLVSEIEDAHLDAFKQARHRIYIENQYLRSSTIAEAIAEAAVQNADLTAMLILPALPDEVAFQSGADLDAQFGLSLRDKAVRTIADAFGDRAVFASPVRPVFATREKPSTLSGSPVIHVHNKVLAIDDSHLMIGSANLNGRSMRWDTEVAVDTKDREHVRHGLDRLMAHWWFKPLPESTRSPETSVAWWRKRIMENGVVRPEKRSGYLVPFDPNNHRDIAQPLPGVTENMV